MDSTDLENIAVLGETKTKICSNISAKNGELSSTSVGISGLVANQNNQNTGLPRIPPSFTPSCRALNDMDRLGGGSTCDFISAIPYKLAAYLLSYTDAYTVVQMGQTSRHWKNVSGDHELWKLLFTNKSWKYDQRAIDNYIFHGKLSNRQQQGDIRSYHYQAQFNRRLINWKRLYRNRTLIEKRWREGDYRVRVFSTTAPTTANANDTTSNNNDNNDNPETTTNGIITDSFYCLQFDNNILVSGGKDWTLKIWSMDTAAYLHTLSGHNGSVLCLHFDGNYLISGSSDTTMIVWDISTRTKIQTLEGHSGGVLALQFVGRRLVSGSKDRTLRIWDLDTGSTTHILNGHRAAVNAIRLKDDRIVSASGDRTVRLWDACTGAMIRTFDSHFRGVACVDFDGDHIISGSSDHTIKMFDSATGDCLRTLSGHINLVRTLQLDTMWNWIISGSYDGSLRIWNMEKGTLLQTLDDKLGNRILNLKADYSKIVWCGNMFGIFMYDFAYDLDTHFLA